MTEQQRKKWAEAVIKHTPPQYLYAGLTFQEASLRVQALFNAAAQVHCWTHLADHLALLHVQIAKKSKLP